MKQPPEVIVLAQKLLKAAGKQNPVTLMNALLVCMETIDKTHRLQPRNTPSNAELKGASDDATTK